MPFVAQQLDKHAGPVIASTDYMKNYADQIRAFMPKGRTYKVLGTDGFGRSDFRSKLREHFEINRHYIVVAALKALAERLPGENFLYLGDTARLPYGTKTSATVERYALQAIRPREWVAGLPTVLVTGGVHGYETSGVMGALRFVDQHGERRGRKQHEIDRT